MLRFWEQGWLKFVAMASRQHPPLRPKLLRKIRLVGADVLGSE